MNYASPQNWDQSKPLIYIGSGLWYVAGEAAKGVAAASFQTGVPVIFGVLTVDTMQQALERAGIKGNLGWNYALNALEMANLMPQIKGQIPLASQPSLSGNNEGMTPALPNVTSEFREA